MSLSNQLKENNILTTIVGFYLVLVVPFFLIFNNNKNKIELLHENKINTKKIVYVEPNTIRPKIFLNGNRIELKPVLDFKKINFIKPLEKNPILYTVSNENKVLGEGFITQHGKLSLNGEILDVKFFKGNIELNFSEGKMSTDNSENIPVSFARSGNIVILEDKVENMKRLKFEKNFINFFIDSVILEKNKLFLNKLIRDENIYNKVTGYNFDSKHYSIKKTKLLDKNFLKGKRSYYALLSPIEQGKDEIEIYLTIEENEKYTKYNSFQRLTKNIKILRIDKDEIEQFKKRILDITKSLFIKNDLFHIELIVAKNKINIQSREKIFKQILNIEDVEVLNVEKQYNYDINKELFRISLKNLSTYNKFDLVFVVDTNIVEENGKKKIKRDIEDLYLEGE